MRYGYCIFCDDIRTEVGDKLSFIGVYNGVLLLPEFPFTLAKLCAHVNLVTPTSEPYRSIILDCRAPGEDLPLLQQGLDAGQLEEQHDLAMREGLGPAQPDIVVGASLMFSPLRLRRPGLLTIRAVIDGEPVEISSLQIAQH
jgi:hypothetical protein